MKCLYINQITLETYVRLNITYARYGMYFKAILDSSSIQRKFCFKPIPDMTYTSNKLSKIYLSFLATIINTLEKRQQNLSIKTPL